MTNADRIRAMTDEELACFVALDSLRSVRRYFLDAKTIVPAEGGGEDG